MQKGVPIPVRNKTATRPWQHVLEPLSGYLWLAARLAQPEQTFRLDSAFNFGPGHDANRTVKELLDEVLRHWPGEWEDKSDPKAVHEANLLQLTTDKAHALLRWSPVWKFSDAVEHTIKWYRASAKGKPAAVRQLTSTQIAAYVSAARALGSPWA
jgi:CDP-glucose 4,6-dehydratase